MMVILKNNVEIFDHHGFIQSYLKCKEPDCILYSKEGMKFKVHKEIFYFSKLMKNIFLDIKDTCCREVEVFCPCSESELESIVNFLYSIGTYFDSENNISTIQDNLTKIFGFSDNISYVENQSLFNKPNTLKIKEEFGLGQLKPARENGTIFIPLNHDDIIQDNWEVDPLISDCINENTNPVIIPLKRQRKSESLKGVSTMEQECIKKALKTQII